MSLSLLVATVGCDINRATGPYFQERGPSSPDAVIYFYRPPRVEAHSRYSARVYDNGQLIGQLDHGGYISYLAGSGRHRLSLAQKDNSDDIWLNIVGGQTYFIKFDYVYRFTGLWGPMYGWVIKSVDGSDALEELRRCRLMEPNN